MLSSCAEALPPAMAKALRGGAQIRTRRRCRAADDEEKEVTRAARKAAGTFAPRSSTAQKNPAQPGTWLFRVFEWQSYLSVVVGGLLSYNVLFPSDEPNIWRLMGFWSVWMFVIPSLRARDCGSDEKDALNLLFLFLPVLNVALPFFYRSFAFVFTADVVSLLAFYWWKVWWPRYARPTVMRNSLRGDRGSGSSDTP